MVTLQDVQAALARIRDRVYLSPCARSETLSKLTGTVAHLKLENLQMTGAYKERGALNKLLLMPAADRDRGLITASAGNHAQAVAYHAGRLGVKATIVMPEATPIMKVANTRAHGARVVLHGSNYDEAYAEARRLEHAEELTFVHPFDDPDDHRGPGDDRPRDARAGARARGRPGPGRRRGAHLRGRRRGEGAPARRQGDRRRDRGAPLHAPGGRGGTPGDARPREHHRRRHRGEARRRPHLRAREEVRRRDRDRLRGGDRERDPVPAREGEDGRRGRRRGGRRRPDAAQGARDRRPQMS